MSQVYEQDGARGSDGFPKATVRDQTWDYQVHGMCWSRNITKLLKLNGLETLS
jgi:hypothetical protein